MAPSRAGKAQRESAFGHPFAAPAVPVLRIEQQQPAWRAPARLRFLWAHLDMIVSFAITSLLLIGTLCALHRMDR